MLRTKRILALVLALMLMLPVGVNSEEIEMETYTSEDYAVELDEAFADEEYTSEVAEDVELSDEEAGAEEELLIEEEPADEEPAGTLFEYAPSDLQDLTIDLSIPFGDVGIDSEDNPAYLVTAGDCVEIHVDTNNPIVADLEWYSSNESIAPVNGTGTVLVNDKVGKMTEVTITAIARSADPMECDDVYAELTLVVFPIAESFTLYNGENAVKNGETIIMDEDTLELELLRDPVDCRNEFQLDMEFANSIDLADEFLDFDVYEYDEYDTVKFTRRPDNGYGIVKFTVTYVGEYKWDEKNDTGMEPLEFYVATSADCAAEIVTTADTYQVATGKKINLNARVLPAYNTDTQALTYATANKKIATVDANGNVKGVKAGTTTITVTDPNTGATKNVTIIVAKAISSVKLAIETGKDAYILTPDETGVQLVPTAKTFNTNVPESAKYIWTSSDESIATVDQNGYVTVETLKDGSYASGKVTITCKANDGSGKSAKVTLTVGKPIRDLAVYSANGSHVLVKGKKMTLKTDYAPTDVVKPVLKWSSDLPKIAKVDSKGVVTGVAAGDAIITAKDSVSGVEQSYKVHVVAKGATKLTLDKTSIEADIDVPETMADVTVIPTVVCTDSASAELIITSSAPKVADAKYVPANAEGEGKIVVTFGNTPGTTAIKVTTADGAKSATINVALKRHATDMEYVTPPDMYVLKGKKTTMKVRLFPEDTTDKVVWVSDAPKIATVSSTGVVTGKAKGEAHITAKIADEGTTVAPKEFTAWVAQSATTKSIKVEFMNPEVDPNTITLRPGESIELMGTQTPDSAAPWFTWTCSDPTLVTLDTEVGERVLVTADPDAAGIVTITATATDGSGKKGTKKLYIQNPVEAIEIVGGTGTNDAGKATLELPQGKTRQLSAVTTPEDATFAKNVTWALAKAADKKYVTVSKTGLVKAVKAYNKYFEVVCTSYDGQVKQSIFVKPVASSQAATSVKIFAEAGATAPNDIFVSGGVSYLYAKAFLKDGETESVIQDFEWKCYEWVPASNEWLDITDIVLSPDTWFGNVSTASVKVSIDKAVLQGDGEIMITAKVLDGSNKVDVLDGYVVSGIDEIQVIGQHSLSVGQIAILSTKISPIEADGGVVTWEAIDGDTNAIELDSETGMVTALVPGTVQVQAIFHNNKGQDDTLYHSEPFTIRVTNPADKMKIVVGDDTLIDITKDDPDNVTTYNVYTQLRKSVQLKAYLYENVNGIEQNINSDVEWDFEDADNCGAYITFDGLVVCEGEWVDEETYQPVEGTATVKVTAPGTDLSATINFVFNPNMPTIKISDHHCEYIAWNNGGYYLTIDADEGYDPEIFGNLVWTCSEEDAEYVTVETESEGYVGVVTPNLDYVGSDEQQVTIRVESELYPEAICDEVTLTLYEQPFLKFKDIDNGMEVFAKSSDEKYEFDIGDENDPFPAKYMKLVSLKAIAKDASEYDDHGEVVADSDVVEIVTDPENPTHVTLKLLKPGEAKIVAKLNDSTNQRWSFKLVVYEDIKTVTITGLPENNTFGLGQEQLQLGYEIRPAGVVADILWESDNEEVATIDNDGKVTIYQEGEFKVTCTAINRADTMDIVTSDPVTLTVNTNGIGFEAADFGTDCAITYGPDTANVTIPKYINGLTVNEIADGAFEDHTAIKSVTIPNAVETIGAAAFKNCSSLATMTGY